MTALPLRQEKPELPAQDQIIFLVRAGLDLQVRLPRGRQAKLEAGLAQQRERPPARRLRLLETQGLEIRVTDIESRDLFLMRISKIF